MGHEYELIVDLIKWGAECIILQVIQEETDF
jgi:hypothetical protein